MYLHFEGFSVSAFVDGINISLQVTVSIGVINWLKEENVVSIHCYLGSISYIQRGNMVYVNKEQQRSQDAALWNPR